MNAQIAGYGVLILAVLGILWRTSALTAKLEMTIEALSKEVELLKAERKALNILPNLEQRVSQLEEIITDFSKTLRGAGQDLGVVGRLRMVEKKLSGEHPAFVKPRGNDPRSE